MARKRAFRALEGIDADRLASFQAGIRKRYSDRDLLTELQECAERLGRSPTMREFAADPQTRVHPQTVIEHFGSWNTAKREAGLLPRRFATREELLQVLRDLGDELGRTPTARDLEERRRSLPSKSLYWHTFGSLTTALREAGFDVPVGEARLEAPSCGARTGGNERSSTKDLSGRKRSDHATHPSASASSEPSATSRFWRRRPT